MMLGTVFIWQYGSLVFSGPLDNRRLLSLQCISIWLQLIMLENIALIIGGHILMSSFGSFNITVFLYSSPLSSRADLIQDP